MASAVRLFATRPFHEVRLDDVAADARVGKGTVYIYFRNKESLYQALVREGLEQLLRRLRDEDLPGRAPDGALTRVVGQLVDFAFDHPQFYQLMRMGSEEQRADMLKLRAALSDLICRIIRRGNRQKIWSDPHPHLTAVLVPGMVRSAMLFGPASLNRRLLARHILRLLRRGLNAREKA